MIYTPFIWPLLIAAALMAGIALYAFRFWDVPAARSFSLLMGLASLWALIYAINISVTVLPLRIFLTLLVYVPMPFNAPVILILALEYTGYTPRLAQQRLWPLFVVPVITGLLSLTSNYHTLFLYDFRWDLSGPFPVLLCTEGPWYWVHIIYRLALLLIACGVLVSSLRARPLHVRNTILIALGIVIPMSADILFHAGITPILGYNFTPTMLVFTGLLYLWALLYFHLFDVVPVARYTIVEAMDDLVIVLDNRGHIVDFNHAAQEACGLTPLTIGATLATLPPAWAKALQRGSNPTLSQQEVTLDVGTGQRMYTVTSSPIQDKRDLTLGHLFLLHDITAFKQIEQELANTKTMLEATFAQTPIPMALISSPDNVIRITNPAIAAYLGIQDEPSRVGTQMIDLLHTRSWSDVDAQGNEVPPQQAPVTLALRGIATRNIEMGVVRKDGTRRWTLASTVPIYNQEGEQIAVHLAFPDITERREAEAKLRQLSRAVEQSASTIMITDRAGTIEYVNPAFTHISGYTPEEAIGQNPRVLKSGKHSREFYKKLWETILSGHEWQGEFLNRKKNGDLYWEHASISPVTNPSGKITNFVAVKEDITARKQAEETLRRYAAELETRNQELDAFAHTVAHDLKNPIGIIVGYAELSLDDSENLPPEEREAFRIIAQSGRKLNTIVDELLVLSSVRSQSITPVPLDMAQIIHEAQLRLRDQIQHSDAEITLQEVATWPTARGYAPWVEEVWANYLSNALKYGGKPPRIEIGADLQANGMVRFWVRDHGPGLSPEDQSRLFTPFTRLDQVRAQGHGLGLSIVQRIGEKLGGQVGVESAIGEGSTFYFTLPHHAPTPSSQSGEGDRG